MILDAAFEAFVEQGYDGASMAEIARRAGVTKPVVYACYPSKEALFGALLAREEQRILAQISAALPAEAETDAEAMLARGFTAFLRAVAESPASYRVIFLGEGGSVAAISERVQAGRAAQVDAIARLAKPWLESRGVADPERPARLLGYSLVGVAEGAARAVLAEPERFTPEETGPMLARMIVRGERAV